MLTVNKGQWNLRLFILIVTLPVYFWRFTFDFGTLLHHFFRHSPAVVKHRNVVQDELNTHTHTHTWADMTVTLGALEASTTAHLQSMSIHDQINLLSSALCNQITTRPTNPCSRRPTNQITDLVIRFVGPLTINSTCDCVYWLSLICDLHQGETVNTQFSLVNKSLQKLVLG